METRPGRQFRAGSLLRNPWMKDLLLEELTEDNLIRVVGEPLLRFEVASAKGRRLHCQVLHIAIPEKRLLLLDGQCTLHAKLSKECLQSLDPDNLGYTFETLTRKIVIPLQFCIQITNTFKSSYIELYIRKLLVWGGEGSFVTNPPVAVGSCAQISKRLEDLKISSLERGPMARLGIVAEEHAFQVDDAQQQLLDFVNNLQQSARTVKLPTSPSGAEDENTNCASLNDSTALEVAATGTKLVVSRPRDGSSAELESGTAASATQPLSLHASARTLTGDARHTEAETAPDALHTQICPVSSESTPVEGFVDLNASPSSGGRPSQVGKDSDADGMIDMATAADLPAETDGEQLLQGGQYFFPRAVPVQPGTGTADGSAASHVESESTNLHGHAGPLIVCDTDNSRTTATSIAPSNAENDTQEGGLSRSSILFPQAADDGLLNGGDALCANTQREELDRPPPGQKPPAGLNAEPSGVSVLDTQDPGAKAEPRPEEGRSSSSKRCRTASGSSLGSDVEEYGQKPSSMSGVRIGKRTRQDVEHPTRTSTRDQQGHVREPSTVHKSRRETVLMTLATAIVVPTDDVDPGLPARDVPIASQAADSKGLGSTGRQRQGVQRRGGADAWSQMSQVVPHAPAGGQDAEQVVINGAAADAPEDDGGLSETPGDPGEDATTQKETIVGSSQQGAGEEDMGRPVDSIDNGLPGTQVSEGEMGTVHLELERDGAVQGMDEGGESALKDDVTPPSVAAAEEVGITVSRRGRGQRPRAASDAAAPQSRTDGDATQGPESLRFRLPGVVFMNYRSSVRRLDGAPQIRADGEHMAVPLDHPRQLHQEKMTPRMAMVDLTGRDSQITGRSRPNRSRRRTEGEVAEEIGGKGRAEVGKGDAGGGDHPQRPRKSRHSAVAAPSMNNGTSGPPPPPKLREEQAPASQAPRPEMPFTRLHKAKLLLPRASPRSRNDAGLRSGGAGGSGGGGGSSRQGPRRTLPPRFHPEEESQVPRRKLEGRFSARLQRTIQKRKREKKAAACTVQ